MASPMSYFDDLIVPYSDASHHNLLQKSCKIGELAIDHFAAHALKLHTAQGKIEFHWFR